MSRNSVLIPPSKLKGVIIIFTANIFLAINIPVIQSYNSGLYSLNLLKPVAAALIFLGVYLVIASKSKDKKMILPHYHYFRRTFIL